MPSIEEIALNELESLSECHDLARVVGDETDLCKGFSFLFFHLMNLRDGFLTD